MPRYIQGQLDWSKFRRDLVTYQQEQGLTGTRLAKQLHVSAAALTRYYQGSRLPSSEVFAFAVVMMGKELREYITLLPSTGEEGRTWGSAHTALQEGRCG